MNVEYSIRKPKFTATKALVLFGATLIIASYFNPDFFNAQWMRNNAYLLFLGSFVICFVEKKRLRLPRWQEFFGILLSLGFLAEGVWNLIRTYSL